MCQTADQHEALQQYTYETIVQGRRDSKPASKITPTQQNKINKTNATKHSDKLSSQLCVTVYSGYDTPEGNTTAAFVPVTSNAEVGCFDTRRRMGTAVTMKDAHYILQ